MANRTIETETKKFCKSNIFRKDNVFSRYFMFMIKTSVLVVILTEIFNRLK